MIRAHASWVIVARIVRPQGRRGELLAEILTDFPESFNQRKRLFLLPVNSSGEIREARGEIREARGEVREARLEAHWPHKGRIVLKFAGIDSIEEGEKLRGFQVAVPREERMPLPEAAVYIEDLIGARVVDVSHGGARDAGEIVDVLPGAPVPGGAGPAMLAVRANAPEPVLIPYVKAYLKKVDLEARRVEMDLPEGLMDINAPLTGEERRRMREEAEEEG